MSKQDPTESNSKEVEGVANLSSNLDTEGFDMQAGETWIYPTNYALRDYQYNIIQEALLKNTMVSLPTGLGKTFIAAVVMYNFYRWYPTSKIIFMAPTRPLVKQQIDACYNIMAIPKEVTAELTGSKNQTLRKEVWREKRVFFITPQVLQNDLDILTELGTKIKCLVFDEAHRAKGNHAYCEVIRKLSSQNKYFRVLGLSATPGNTLLDVIGVIRNLLISHLEIRTDDSPDVLPFIFQRSLESVVVPLGEKLEEVRDSYMQILEKYTRVLINHRVILGNCSTLTKGKIFMTMKDYQEKNRNGRDRAYPEIMRNLNICITLYHAYELLIRHGLRGFLSFFEEHIDKPTLRGNVELQCIMGKVRDYLGPAPNVEPLPDGTIAEIPESTKFGHPKYYKLRDILSDHFTDASNSGSRVIIFCEYRESVMEAYALLLRYKPLVRPKIFLGQGAITQRQQINVIKSFREGECNTLISTCIGEEGLDVGDVDLIVCFDISNKSPLRMVQRMGRTGRKRQGRVVVLVTEGKEQETLKECLIHKQNLIHHILQSTALYKEMYTENPRMVPPSIDPKCYKLYITVTPESNPQLARKKSNSLKDMFDNISRKRVPSFHEECDINILEMDDKLPIKQEYWSKGDPLAVEINKNRIDFSKRLGKLRVLQPTGEIGHSRSSEMLVSLLQFAESKKFNIPMTQVPVMPSQISSPKKTRKIVASDGYKQADIRNMLFKPAASELMLGNADFKSLEEKEEINSHKETSNQLYSEITSYLTIKIDDESNCKICENLFDCSQFMIPIKELDLKSWIEPDHSIFDSLTAGNLNIFADSMSPKSNKLYSSLNLTEAINCENESNAKTEVSVNIQNKQENEFDFADRSVTNFDDTFGFKDSPFKAPNGVHKVLKKLNLDDSVFNNVAFTQMETIAPVTAAVQESKISDKIIPCTLDVKAFEDAEFTQMITEEAANNDVRNVVSKPYQDTLSFFNITAVEELFGDSCIKTPTKTPPQSQTTQDTIIYTPDCFSSNKKDSPQDEESSSPILCTFDRARLLKSRAHKRLFETSVQDGLRTKNNNQINVEQVLETVSKLERKVEVENISTDIFNDTVDNTVVKPSKPKLYKLLQQKEATKSTLYNSKTKNFSTTPMKNDCYENEKVDQGNSSGDLETDVIDTSMDNIFENIAASQIIKKDKKIKKNKPGIAKQQLDTDCKETDIDISDMFDLSVFGLDKDLTKTLLSSTHIQKSNKKPNDLEVCQNSIVKSTFDTDNSVASGTHKRELTKNMENNSVQNTVDVLHDFCDESFLDMFFENNLCQDEGTKKENECKNNTANINLVQKKTHTSNIVCGNPKPCEKENIFLSVGSNNVLKDNTESNKKHTQKLDINYLNREKQGQDKFEKNTILHSTEESKNRIDKKWEEDSIWDFCLSWDKNKVNSEFKGNIGNTQISNSEQNKSKNTKNNSPFKLSTKKNSKDSEEKDIISDSEWNVDNDMKSHTNDFVKAKSKRSPKRQKRSPEIVDLTSDSPNKSKTANSKSSTLVKSQQNNIYIALKSEPNNRLLSQPQMSNYVTRSTDVNLNTMQSLSQVLFATQPTKKNTSKPTGKTKTQSRLQLNKKDGKNSITSMQWFTKNAESHNNAASQILATNSKLASTISNSVGASKEPTVCISTSSKINLSPVQSQSNLNSNFNFTSNTKKLSVKNNSNCKNNVHSEFDATAKNAGNSISPVLNINKTIVKRWDTPKKSGNLKVAFMNSDSSDDDFELPSKKTLGWIKPKSKNIEIRKSPLVKDLNKNSTCTTEVDKRKCSGRNKVKKKLEECPYFDLEAEVSTHEDELSDSDVEDRFEESFVDDDTQSITNNTAMHAQYLQSVRSPVLNRGKFKIPERPRSTAINVYSQIDDFGQNTYVNDSFCVDTEALELSQKADDISELELAELILAEERRNKKKKRKKLDKGPNRKRLRILESSSESD